MRKEICHKDINERKKRKKCTKLEVRQKITITTINLKKKEPLKLPKINRTQTTHLICMERDIELSGNIFCSFKCPPPHSLNAEALSPEKGHKGSHNVPCAKDSDARQHDAQSGTNCTFNEKLGFLFTGIRIYTI